jgi:hypothetical protein
LLAKIVRSRWFVTALAVLLILGGLLAILQGVGVFQALIPAPRSTPLPTKVPERLVPTITAIERMADPPSPAPTGTLTSAREPSATPVSVTRQSLSPTASPSPTKVPTVSTPTALPSETPTPTPSPRPSETPVMGLGLFSPWQRVGLVAPKADVEHYDAARLGGGWYLTGTAVQTPSRPGRMEFVQVVQVEAGSFQPQGSKLQEIALSNPGSLWLVGNEPDVIWQDNARPDEYARVYHDVYHLLKEADPSSQVAIGGVSQVTPLRLRYLEQVLAAYEETFGQSMPVDVWNIHLAILREERGAWGVDIPPGMPDTTGVLYEIEDNADLGILKEQVRTFRNWMAQQAQRNKPLIVSEFSVLMPPEYGFPTEAVRDFMLGSFDFLLTVTDGAIGLQADGGRLVQRFAWYSLADEVYFTGNLCDPDTGQITALGEAFAAYTSGLSP